MKDSSRILAAALVGVALAAAGCGADEEGKPIPAATAGNLDAQLGDVEKRLDQGSPGACRDILEAPKSRGADKEQVQALIDSMPDDVDSDVRSALQDSFDNLWDLVEQECEDKESEQDQKTTPTDTQEETTPTETTEPETTPTEPETTPTTPETSPETAPLPNDGNGEGGGAVPGDGDGGGGVGPSAQEQKKEQKK